MAEKALLNRKMVAFGNSNTAIRNAAARGQELKKQIGAENVFDFTIGNPFKPAPDEVREGFEQALQTLPQVPLHGYVMGSGIQSLREAIADDLNKKFGGSYTADDLIISTGASGAGYATIAAITNPGEGDEVIVLAPYFMGYEGWIESAGCVRVQVNTKPDTFQLDIDALDAAINEHTRAIIMDSPNNPTGAIYPAEDLKALGEMLARKEKELGQAIFLISDEPYRELVLTQGIEVPWVPDFYDDTIVLYSYSKCLSIPGDRCGWSLVGEKVSDSREVLAAIAGAARWNGLATTASTVEHAVEYCVRKGVRLDPQWYIDNRDALYAGLVELGYEPFLPDGAFYLWLKTPIESAVEFAELAVEHHIMVTPGETFGWPGYVRVTFCCDLDTIKRSMPAWTSLKAEVESRKTVVG
ncbi:MAG: pyridoxal phosphate-dependent aminotransferase [Coriobacteriia bacterium]|nr:pyridoxal phosphate-dependent aminotransferase [Coriobacteriia bacterium]